MFEVALELVAQGLLTQLPASLLTAGATVFCTWVVRRWRKPKD